MWRRSFRSFCHAPRAANAYRGAYPAEPLADGDFDVAVKVYLDADRPVFESDCKGQLVRRRPDYRDGGGRDRAGPLFTAASGSPSGGRTALERKPSARSPSPRISNHEAPRRLRTVAVVTGDDTDPDYINGR